MATACFLLTCSLVLTSLLIYASADEGNVIAPEQMANKTAVQGVVMCQSCSQKGTWSLKDASGLEGATVGIACKDHKYRITFYDIFTTGPDGYFYAPLEGLAPTDHHRDTPVHACKVHLIASVNHTCNLLTNINDGIGGSALRFVNKQKPGTDEETDLYSAGPLAFRPVFCLL